MEGAIGGIDCVQRRTRKFEAGAKLSSRVLKAGREKRNIANCTLGRRLIEIAPEPDGLGGHQPQARVTQRWRERGLIWRNSLASLL